MSSPREIELKLELPVAAAKALRRGTLKRLGVGPAKAQALSSVYFDTPKHLLLKKGFALRVRSSEDGNVQTVKLRDGASAGLFSRSEWETAIDGREPEWHALKDTPAARLLSKGKRLTPVFETVVDRTSWTVSAGRSTVEIALDEGHVVAGRKSQGFAELELELKAGSPGDLFDLARRIGEKQAFKLGVLTKSERGYALASGDKPACFKAETVSLTRDLTAAEAFQRVAHACVRQFRLNEPIVVEERTVEALHEARVAMRRLRSALSLFKDLVADDKVDILKTGLRDLSRRLGDARNLDVYIERALVPEVERDGAEPGVYAFFDHVQTLREQAYDKVAADLNAPATQRLMLDFMAWIQDGPWLTDSDPQRAKLRDQPVVDLAVATLAKRDRTVRKTGKKLADLDPPTRHRVRIAAKKLRYASEFFSALNTSKADKRKYEKFVKAMKVFQEDLGELNDLHTGHELAADLAHQVEEAGLERATLLFAAGHLSGEQDEQVGPLLQHAETSYAGFADAPRFWRDWT